MSSGAEHHEAPAHDGLFYSSDQELLTFVVPFLREGFAQNEAAVVVANQRTRELLEPELAELGPVQFVAPPVVFRRTATAVLAYQDLIDQALARGAKRIRAVSEVDFGDTSQARLESIRFEAVANLALAHPALWNVCLYDARQTPQDLLGTSTHAHPWLVTDHQRVPNPDYLPPAELLRRHSQSRPYRIEATPPQVDLEDVKSVGLTGLRRAINLVAVAESVMPRAQIDDFLAAMTEIASNALQHGRGRVRVRVWVSQQRMVSTVTDGGTGFDDPLAGFLPVADGQQGDGTGLWLARNFCDSLDFSSDADGFTARLASWTS